MLTDFVGPLLCQHLKKNIVNSCTQGPTEERIPEAARTVAAAARVNVRGRSMWSNEVASTCRTASTLHNSRS